MNIKQLPMNVIGYASVFVLTLMVLFSLVVKPNEEKKEYMGVVTHNHMGNATIVLSEMEPPFKQTLKGQESIIEATILKVSGETLIVKHDNTLYRVHKSKVVGETQVDKNVQVSVILKGTETRTVNKQWYISPGDIVTTRTNLSDLDNTHFTKEGGAIYTNKAPVNTVREADEESFEGKYVIVSNGQASEISKCEEVIYVYKMFKKHDEDGIFVVKGDRLKALGDIRNTDSDSFLRDNPIPCTIRRGDTYTSFNEVLNQYPFGPKSNQVPDYLYWFLLPLGAVTFAGVSGLIKEKGLL